MSVEKEPKNENIQENLVKRLNNTDNNLPKVKKHKKSTKKSRFSNQIKVVPLLKPPSERRKYDENGNLKNQEIIRQKSGIIWDNKTIDEQYLDRIQHPRIKIDEPKTPYPDGDENDLYQEGMNKLNEIKPTQELLNEVVNSLLENDDEKKKNLKTKELKKKAYDASPGMNPFLKADVDRDLYLLLEEHGAVLHIPIPLYLYRINNSASISIGDRKREVRTYHYSLISQLDAICRRLGGPLYKKNKEEYQEYMRSLLSIYRHSTFFSWRRFIRYSWFYLKSRHYSPHAFSHIHKILKKKK